MALKPKLITLLPSTGCDLGRWLLAHYGVDYTEKPHAPIFHILALKYWGFGPEEYPGLVKGSTKLGGDSKILPWLEENYPNAPSLLPDKETEPQLRAEVESRVTWAHEKVAGQVVNWSYWNFLKYKWVVWPSVTTKVPWYEKLTLFLAFPLIRWAMYKGLKLDQSVADQSLKELYAGFDELDALLADGRDYLVGGRLTYADLSVAALLGPMILVQGYHGMLPDEARCPVFMQEVYKELRQRPTGKFIQRMYDTHRPAQELQVS